MAGPRAAWPATRRRRIRRHVELAYVLLQVLLEGVRSYAMPLPTTILVPTDFGEPSEAALDRAIDYARAFGASVVLMHAFELPIVGFPESALAATAELGAQMAREAREGLEYEAARHEASGVVVRSVVKEGEPARMAIETAEEVGAGLICIGTHGRKGLPRMLLGSVAEKVVRTSRVPVLTVQARDHAMSEERAPSAPSPESAPGSTP